MAYKNVDYDSFNIEIISGDTWDMTFSVSQNGVLYDMTGMQLDIEVKENEVGGAVVATASSAGMAPAITIAASSFNVYLVNAFTVTETTKYKFDVQLTNGTTVSTVARGYIRVLPEVTD